MMREQLFGGKVAARRVVLMQRVHGHPSGARCRRLWPGARETRPGRRWRCRSNPPRTARSACPAPTSTMPLQASGVCTPLVGSYANGLPTGGEASTANVPTRSGSAAIANSGPRARIQTAKDVMRSTGLLPAECESGRSHRAGSALPIVLPCEMARKFSGGEPIRARQRSGHDKGCSTLLTHSCDSASVAFTWGGDQFVAVLAEHVVVPLLQAELPDAE